jgi:transposase
MARTDPELTDVQWAALEPLLPPQRPATGRPNYLAWVTLAAVAI